MRGLGELGGEVLACEMQLLVQAGPPFRAIRHIVHDTVAGDPEASAAFAGVATELRFRDDVIGSIHDSDPPPVRENQAARPGKNNDQ